MISYFPDINVWMAVSVEGHCHNLVAARWLSGVRRADTLVFSRYTQMGFLRLLTSVNVMGTSVLTTRAAWAAFDRWLEDPRVRWEPEPRTIETAFRQATAPFSGQPASKAIGDCYLLAFARETSATLVTFDQALMRHAGKYRVIVPE